jgi:hypothetical protein
MQIFAKVAPDWLWAIANQAVRTENKGLSPSKGLNFHLPISDKASTLREFGQFCEHGKTYKVVRAGDAITTPGGRT